MTIPYALPSESKMLEAVVADMIKANISYLALPITEIRLITRKVNRQLVNKREVTNVGTEIWRKGHSQQ